MPTRLGTLTVGTAALLALASASCAPSGSGTPGPSTSSTAEDDDRDDALDLIERRTAEAIARLRESAVALEYSASDGPTGTRRVASGVVISEDGDVLSVRIDPPSSASPVTARAASGRRLPAQWVAADPQTGLTLLRIAPGLARPASPSKRGPRLGAQVLLIGNPFGLGHSAGHGFVSGLNRRLELGPRQLGGLIQVDAALHPGDSGALLADLHGGWLGLIRSGLAEPSADRDKDKRGREHDHDLGFAIPAKDALWVATRLRDHKRVDRAYLGVTMLEPSPADPADGADSPSGVVLDRVLDDTPAGRAGLIAGDRLVALNDQPVRTASELTDRLDRTEAGLDVTLDYIRAGRPERQRLVLRTAQRPPPPPPDPVKVSTAAPAKPKAGAPTLSPEVVNKIERLERRIEELEKREAAQTQQP